jgi:hypothetical protein
MITIPLEQKDFTNGTYTVTEKIQSVRSGTFNITAEVTPLLAPITGEALPQTTETTQPTAAAKTPTVPQRASVPAASPPTRPKAAGLGTIDAYYVASTHTLHVWNATHFQQGIKNGKFQVTWTTGASRATVRDADGSPIAADVISDDPKPDTPPGPNIGDVKYVEKQQTNSVDGSKGACEKIPGLFTDKPFLGRRQIHRGYTELVNTGDDSGTETYQVIARNYFYDATDCTSGYSSSTDTEERWVLTVKSWPEP